MEPSHLTDYEVVAIRSAMGICESKGYSASVDRLRRIIDHHTEPKLCGATLYLSTLTLECVGGPGHGGPHLAATNNGHLKVTWFDDRA